jgi:hypothetical protein
MPGSAPRKGNNYASPLRLSVHPPHRTGRSGDDLPTVRFTPGQGSIVQLILDQGPSPRGRESVLVEDRSDQRNTDSAPGGKQHRSPRRDFNVSGSPRPPGGNLAHPGHIHEVGSSPARAGKIPLGEQAQDPSPGKRKDAVSSAGSVQPRARTGNVHQLAASRARISGSAPRTTHRGCAQFRIPCHFGSGPSPHEEKTVIANDGRGRSGSAAQLRENRHSQSVAHRYRTVHPRARHITGKPPYAACRGLIKLGSPPACGEKRSSPACRIGPSPEDAG